MSKGIIIKIVNNTGEDAVVSASIGNKDDWSGDDRPDVNVKGTIGAFNSNHWHEELASSSSTAPFTLNVTFSSGETIQVDLDGWETREEEFRRKIPVRSSSAPKYVAFQYTGTPEPSLAQSNWSQMTISISVQVDPGNWMSKLDSSLTLDKINIPGTHDSGTFGGNGVEGSRTQSMSITEQLNAGVRWLDLRLCPDGNDFSVWHGIVKMPLKLSTILMNIKDFLANHPNEAVITCVSYEKNSPSVKEGEAFDKLLHTCYMQGVAQNKLFDQTAMPTLGGIRGCVVLLRRDAHATFGMRANAGWPDNSTLPFSDNGVDYYVEDEYKFFMQPTWQKTFDLKFSYVKAALDHSLSNPNWGKWCFIFTSATLKTAPVAGYYPWDFASGPNGENGLLFQYLIAKTKAKFGTIIMDFPEEPSNAAVIDLLLSMNTYLKSNSHNG
jgi:1-phosphatidylinositol phosphodiesterase